MEKDLILEIEQLTNWTIKGKYIVREIQLESFPAVLDLMMKIGLECEKMNHHPEWTNVYNKLKIKLTTHDTGDISSKDIQLAKKIDRLLI